MLAIVAEDESRSEIAAGVEAIVVLDRTTMYAEMGGQVADHGTITGPDGVFGGHGRRRTRAVNSCTTAAL